MNHTLTEENIKKLKDEMDYRMTVKRAEIAKVKAEAAALGDRSENAEYKAACEAYRENDDRIQYLLSMITNATVIPDETTDKSALNVGGKARIRFIEDDDEDTVTLVTTMDSDPAKMYISIESDLGKALFGKKAGETIEVNAPSGKYMVEVLEIL